MGHSMLSGSIVLAGPAAETTRLVAFWVLAIISVAAALGMVLARKAVHCAMLLAVVMLSLAVLYAMLGAPFLAFVQVIVYTGAVLMLFLFVLMIVGISAADSVIETIRGQRLWAAIGGIAMLVLLALVVGHAAIGPAAARRGQVRQRERDRAGQPDLHAVRVPVRGHQRPADHRGPRRHGARAPRAHRPKPTQRDLAAQRVASGQPTPLPGPGTYARHNAVDMPALLPDGTQSELSVSPVLSGVAARLTSAVGGGRLRLAARSQVHAGQHCRPARMQLTAPAPAVHRPEPTQRR